MKTQGIRNQRGMALFMALLLLVVLATLAVGAIMLSGNASLLGKYHAKDAEMRASADAGLEWARDTLNGTLGILPPAGFVILQFQVPVRDAGGTVIPGFTRSVFAGRSGTTTGQFGVYASVISRIDDNAGRAVVVRRAELAQESFSQFARFDDTTVSSVVFANGIQVFGPIHTNGPLYVGASATPAVFHGLATTAQHHPVSGQRDLPEGLQAERGSDQPAHPGQPGDARWLRHHGGPLARGRGTGDQRCTTHRSGSSSSRWISTATATSPTKTRASSGSTGRNNNAAADAELRDRPHVEHRVRPPTPMPPRPTVGTSRAGVFMTRGRAYQRHRGAP